MLWLLLKELPERSLTFGSKATYLVTVSAAAAPDNRSPLYMLGHKVIKDIGIKRIYKNNTYTHQPAHGSNTTLASKYS